MTVCDTCHDAGDLACPCQPLLAELDRILAYFHGQQVERRGEPEEFDYAVPFQLPPEGLL